MSFNTSAGGNVKSFFRSVDDCVEYLNKGIKELEKKGSISDVLTKQSELQMVIEQVKGTVEHVLRKDKTCEKELKNYLIQVATLEKKLNTHFQQLSKAISKN